MKPCPNCQNVNGVPFCPIIGVFTPDSNIQRTCEERQQGRTALTYKEFKKRGDVKDVEGSES